MCTLIALHRCVPGAPIVIAANRDEFLDRPASPPTLWAGEGPELVAPRDLKAGGTWLGLNRTGLFAGLTNRPVASLDPSPRSRGSVVVRALGAASADEAAEDLLRLPAGVFNPFNLLLADRQRAFAVVYDGAPTVRELAPGVHVIGNADPDDRSVPKVAALLARAEAAAAGPAGRVLDALAAICRGHSEQGRSRESACIHLDAYGTRSSTLLRLGAEPADGTWRWAEGPPCTTPYRDITGLLHVLESGPRQTAGEHETRALP